MANTILPNNEVVEFEDTIYTNPQVSLDESSAFIDNLRSIQNQNNSEINAQTTNLGSYPASASNLGGLGGSESYFTARYQTPQAIAIAANLDASARAQAQNEVLNNQLSALKQRYNNAYRAYQQRYSSGNGGYYSNKGDGLLPVDTILDDTAGYYSPSSNNGPGYLNVDERGTYYVSTDGTKRYNLRGWDYTGNQDSFSGLYSPAGAGSGVDNISAEITNNKYKSGDIITGNNGVQYLYYPGAQSSGGGSYYPITSIEDL